MSHPSTGLIFAGLTDVGLHRSANQDSYYISQSGNLFIVADGMGGHAGGQEASNLCIDAIKNYFDAYYQSECNSAQLLEKAILCANQAILNDQCQHLERADMGTTVVILTRRNHQFWCAHVGDSRLYLFRKDELIQITQDHTWVAQAIQSGELSANDLTNHPWRHVLSQCVGREDLSAVETQRVETQPGDWLLLCSDGLTEELSIHDIANYLRLAQSCEDAVSTLIAAAKARGGRDNITAVTVGIL